MTRAVTSASDRLAEPLAAFMRALWVAAFAREHYGRRDAPSSADRSASEGFAQSECRRRGDFWPSTP